MREILFKGQRVDAKEWVEGFLFVRKDTQGKIIDCFIIEDCYEQIIYGQRYVQSILNRECFRVIPETVGQYTGLKDKNGKKIFEGDICSTDLSRPYLVVEFRNGCFMYQCEDNGETYYDIMTPIEPLVDADEFTEVIGNIHDTPELLGGDKE